LHFLCIPQIISTLWLLLLGAWIWDLIRSILLLAGLLGVLLGGLPDFWLGRFLLFLLILWGSFYHRRRKSSGRICLNWFWLLISLLI